MLLKKKVLLFVDYCFDWFPYQIHLYKHILSTILFNFYYMIKNQFIFFVLKY